MSSSFSKDPRTGATIGRRKDVLAGKLHPLLDAWRVRAE